MRMDLAIENEGWQEVEISEILEINLMLFENGEPGWTVFSKVGERAQELLEKGGLEAVPSCDLSPWGEPLGILSMWISSSHYREFEIHEQGLRDYKYPEVAYQPKFLSGLLENLETFKAEKERRFREGDHFYEPPKVSGGMIGYTPPPSDSYTGKCPCGCASEFVAGKEIFDWLYLIGD